MNPGLLVQAIRAQQRYRASNPRAKSIVVRRAFGRYIHQHDDGRCTFNPLTGRCWSDLDNRDAVFTLKYRQDGHYDGSWRADVAIAPDGAAYVWAD